MLNSKMLHFFKFLPEEYEPQEKDIDGAANLRMLLYGSPGLFHAGAPVYVVKNQYGVVVRPGKELLKIVQGRLQPVIAIDIAQIDTRRILQNAGQQVVEISVQRLNV